MAVKTRCKCGKKIAIENALAGKTAKCPACGRLIPVPNGSFLAQHAGEYVELSAFQSAGPGATKGVSRPVHRARDSQTAPAGRPHGGSAPGAARPMEAEVHPAEGTQPSAGALATAIGLGVTPLMAVLIVFLAKGADLSTGWASCLLIVGMLLSLLMVRLELALGADRILERLMAVGGGTRSLWLRASGAFAPRRQIALPEIPDQSDGEAMRAIRREPQCGMNTEERVIPCASSSPFDSTPSTEEACVWQVGEVIEDTYEVRGSSSGGMGIVYFCRHRAWDMDIAVKTIRPDAITGKNPDRVDRALARISREAKSWVDLGLHPNVVTCYYVRRFGDQPCLFLEYVGGGDLDRWIAERAGGEDLSTKLDLAIQICDGVAHAHDNGLIHRDLKPSNILLTEDGLAKITDFGLVKASMHAVARRREHPEANSCAQLSRPGLGTPPFMPPEQFDTADVDRTADVYSFGVMLYQLLCGELPFVPRPPQDSPQWDAGQQTRWMKSEFRRLHHEVEPTSLHGVESGLPMSLSEFICAECLAKQADRRPQNFRAIRDRLCAIYKQTTKHDYPREAPRPGALLADSLNNRALSLMDLGHVDDALRTWYAGLSADPAHMGCIYNLSLAEWRTGRETDFAILDRLTDLARVQRDNADVQVMLGMVDMERGSPQEAQICFDKASRLQPSAAEAWAGLGEAHLAQRHVEDAETALKEAVRLRPESRQPRLRLARALLDQQREREALEYVTSGELRAAAELIFPNWQCERTTEFRDADGTPTVSQAVLSCRNGLILVAGMSRPIALWDLSTGACVRDFPNCPSGSLLGLSHDGRFAVSRNSPPGQEGTQAPLCVWAVESGASIGIVETGEKLIRVAFAGDHRRLVALCDGARFRTWDVSTGKCICAFDGEDVEANRMAVPSNGQCVIIGGKGKLLVYDPLSGSRIRSIETGSDGTQVLDVSPNGRYALCAHDGSSLRLWDLKQGQCVRVLKGQAELSCGALDPKGRLAVSGEYLDGTLCVWDLRTGKCLRTFRAHGEGVDLVGFVGLGPRVASFGLLEATVKLWAMESQSPQARAVMSTVCSSRETLAEQERVERTITLVRSRLQGGGYREAHDELRQLRTTSGAARRADVMDLWHHIGTKAVRKGFGGAWPVATLDGHRDYVTSVRFSIGGDQILSGSQDGGICVWNPANQTCLKTIPAHERAVTDLAMFNNGTQFVSAARDETLRVWDIQTGDCLRVVNIREHWATPEQIKARSSLPFCPEPVRECSATTLAVSPAGPHVLSGNQDALLWLWDITSGEHVTRFVGVGHSLKPGAARAIYQVAISPDGLWALSGGDDGTVRLWDMKTGSPAEVLDHRQEAITSVAFLPDGVNALYGCADGVLVLYDLLVRQPVSYLDPQLGGMDLAVLADGHYAVSSHPVGMRVWDLRASTSNESWAQAGGVVALSPDGRYAAFAQGNQIRIWEFDWEWHVPAEADWDEDARRSLEIFLAAHTPAKTSLWRRSRPTWTEDDFQTLLTGLSHAGYGWLRPAGVRRALKKVARRWRS